MITHDERTHWHAKGWVAFESLLPSNEREGLDSWVAAVARDPGDGDRRLHYREATAQGSRLCRTERFLEDHDELRNLITGPQLSGIAAALLEDGATLYKEKINYKNPGGAGYAAHQDAMAYAFVNHHVTCLIAVDPMTPDNGCLEFASGRYDRLLETDDRGCVHPALADALSWEPVPLPVGGVVFFSSLVPHRSGENRSDQPRRALYLTYNAGSEGDLRSNYYDERSRTMAAAAQGGAGGTDSLRISTIGHFQGRPAKEGGQS